MIGELVRTAIEHSPPESPAKVLIEKNGTRFYHVEAASQYPENFVAEESLQQRLSLNQLGTDVLKRQGIGLLVIRAVWIDLVKANIAYFKKVVVNDRWIFIELP